MVGFGTFEVRSRSERQGRDPRTNSPITIPASKVPAFKVGKAFKLSLIHIYCKVIMLSGPSGSGKTTTARILQKLLKEKGVSAVPVSYTHLDVYKRQGMSLAEKEKLPYRKY